MVQYERITNLAPVIACQKANEAVCEGWGRREYDVLGLSKPIPWNVGKSEFRSWSLYIHLLDMIDALLSAHCKTGGWRYLFPTLRIELDWVKMYRRGAEGVLPMAECNLAEGLRGCRLGVTSRGNIWPSLEQFWPLAMPVLQRADGCSSLEGGLWQLSVANSGVAQDARLQLFVTSEMVALQHLLDPAVEALEQPVGLRSHLRGQAVFGVEGGVEPVEVIVAGGGAPAQPEKPFGELFSVFGQHPGDLYRRGALQSTQEPAGVGGRLHRVDAPEDPAGGAVDGDEEVATPFLIGHLRKVFHMDVEIDGLISLEGFVRRLQLLQPRDPMPTQAPAQPRARDVRDQKLPHNLEQIVERQRQRPAQNHRLLGSHQRRLQPMWRMSAVLHACLAYSTAIPSAQRLRSAPPPPRPARCWSGSPPEPSAWSLPACEAGSACQLLVPIPSEERPCH